MAFQKLSKEDIELFGLNKPKEKVSPVPQPDSTNDSAATTSAQIDPIDSKAKKIVDNAAKEDFAFNKSYAGAIEYNDEGLEAKFRCLEYETPFDMLAMYDANIRLGVVTLYPWQMETLDTFGRGNYSIQEALQFALCAANGSGKDAFIVAPFVVWHSLCKIQSRTIITSASGGQLGTQTEGYIRNLCQLINDYHGQEIFRIRQRYIYCRLSGSEIRLFATDEEGKAEGYHPITPLSSMAIVINEGKSVKDFIYRALSRCTGYSYWLEVSSPGAPHGDFAKHFEFGTSGQFGWKSRRVDYTECPHGSENQRQQDLVEYGEFSSIYRSKWLALFTNIEGTSIIPQDAVERCKKLSKDGMLKVLHQDWIPRIGIDIAAGGDETSMYKVLGNVIKAELHFREKDTTISALRINDWLLSVSIPKDSEMIFADDGGIGHAVIDTLCSDTNGYGWRIARVNNQSPSNNKRAFVNRGAQNWFRIKRLFESNLLYFPQNEEEKNAKLFVQLCSRFYSQQATQGRIALESKATAKAQGRPSPDRADAYVLAFTGLSVSDFIDGANSNQQKSQAELNPMQKLKRDGEKLRDVNAVEAWGEKKRYDEYQRQGERAKGKPIRGSIRRLIGQRIGREVVYNGNN